MSQILLIGPRELKNSSKKTGGIVVLFEDLLKQCNTLNIDYIVIDTNKANYTNKIIAYFLIIYLFLKYISRVTTVSLHGTANDYIFIAPIVVFISRRLKRRVSLRKFAGNFNEIYDNSSKVIKFLIKYVLKNANELFFETKYLVSKFKVFNDNIYWFPNVREKSLFKTDSIYRKKFIFIGHVREEKGVKEILEVSNMLDDSYLINLYGYLFDNMKNVDFSKYKAEYKGSLLPSEVLKKLSEYDVLVLPTYWKGEGYPGVIIEALSVGMPVIASNLAGISEMLDDGMSTLIEPKNLNELQKAIESISVNNYSEMSQRALNQFSHFDTSIQTKIYLKRIGIL